MFSCGWLPPAFWMVAGLSLLPGGGADEQRLGARVVPFPHIKQAELTERGERLRMVGAETRAADLERALEIILGLVVIAGPGCQQQAEPVVRCPAEFLK